MNKSRAFVELTTYIKKAVESGINVFKLTELHSVYVSRLNELCVEKQVNKIRLKSFVLEYFSEAQEQYAGRHTLLVFKVGMKDILKDTLRTRDFDEDAVSMAEAAKIIRNDILSHFSFKFTSSFPAGCQERSISSSSKYLIVMITKGLNFKDREKCDLQACTTAGQVIMYITTKKTSPSAMASRHSLE